MKQANILSYLLLLLTPIWTYARFSFIIPDRQVNFFDSTRIDKLEIIFDTQILNSDLNNTLNKLVGLNIKYDNSDLNDLQKATLARTEDKILTESISIREKLNAIRDFRGIQMKTEDHQCKTMIQTVSTGFILLLEISIEITMKTVASLSADKYSETILTANTLFTHLSDVNKNLTTFHTALQTLQSNGNKADIKHLFRSSSCIDKTSSFIIKESYCTRSIPQTCYVSLHYLSLTKTLTKYNTISYNNHSLCYPLLYRSQDSFMVSDCEEPDCPLKPLPPKENGCLQDLLEDPQASIHDCRICLNNVQLFTSKIGTLVSPPATFQAVIVSPPLDQTVKPQSYTYVHANGSIHTYDISSKIDIKTATSILSANTFMITIANKKYLFRANSRKNQLTESSVTSGQLEQLMNTGGDWFDVEIWDLILPSSLSTLTICLLLLLKYFVSRLKKKQRRRALSQKLEKIQRGHKKNRESKQLIQFLNNSRE